jgi:hypothetical protein
VVGNGAFLAGVELFLQVLDKCWVHGQLNALAVDLLLFGEAPVCGVIEEVRVESLNQVVRVLTFLASLRC